METEYLNSIDDSHINGEATAPEVVNNFGSDTDFSLEDQDFFNELKGGRVEVETESPGNNVSPGNIDPRLAVGLLDTMLTALLVIALRYAGKDAKKSELKATEAEKRTLEPLIENCLKTINWNIDNPWSALAVSVVFIYGSKILVGWETLADREDRGQEVREYGEHIAPGAYNQPVKRGRGRPRKNG
jgi:hypothetical protein